MSGGSVQVIVASGDQLMRAGLAALIAGATDIELAGEAEDEAELLELLALPPDVCVIDLQLSDSTVDLLEGLPVRCPQLRTVVITSGPVDQDCVRCFNAGVAAVLQREDLKEETMLHAVRAVGGGLMVVTGGVRAVLQQKVAAAPGLTAIGASELAELTPREQEVLALIACARTNADIATELTLSETTVKGHVSSVLAKLGARDRAQAIVLAYERGLVTPAVLPEVAQP